MTALPRKLVQRCFALGGMQVRRLRADGGPHPTYLLDLLCESLRARSAPGWIVQIGANDGLLDDPIHNLLSKQYWPAVLVEPFPDYFDKLSRTYRGCSGIHLFNVAVGSASGQATLYTVDASAGLPPWVQGLATFDKTVLLSHQDRPELRGFDLKKLLRETKVPVVSARAIVHKFGIDAIVLLQVDTEGHDAVVVNSFLDSGVRPLMINYERKHLPFKTERSLRDVLAARGYSLVDVGPDTLATHDEGLQALFEPEPKGSPAAATVGQDSHPASPGRVVGSPASAV